ncbi:MAG: tetratricopeptide repeat protein [Saprospiraceae bacterium]|nr:tetratricopeptide repeat protein [Saprospiraceae bacterium]
MGIYRLIIFLASLQISQLFSQNNLIRGVVLYQNSGGVPAAGVQINSFNANSRFTSSSGMFELHYSNKKAGDLVKLIIGGTDNAGKKIEVVNSKQLEILRIPANPDDILEIIVCPAGSRDAAAIRFYGILSTSANEDYNKRINDIERQIRQLNGDQKRVKQLEEQLEALRKERDDALKKVEEQAQFIASINKDRASEIVKKAIELIETNKDIQHALELLDNIKLDEAYLDAQGKKIKAEAEIKQVIEGYKLKISLLQDKKDIPEKIICYEKIINIFIENQFDLLELSTIYDQVGIEYMRQFKYETAVEMLTKAIEIKRKMLLSTDASLLDSYLHLSWIFNAAKNYSAVLSTNQIVIDTLKKYKMIEWRLVDTYRLSAEALLKLKEPKNALPYLKEALDIAKTTQNTKSDAMKLSIILEITGKVYKEMKQYEQALPYYEESISMKENVLDNLNPGLAFAYDDMSKFLLETENIGRAIYYEEKAINILEKSRTPHDVRLINLYTNLYNHYGIFKYYQKALDVQHKVLQKYEKLYPSDDNRFPHLYRYIAENYILTGDYSMALGCHENALAYYNSITDHNRSFVAGNYKDLAGVHLLLGDISNAMMYFEKILSLADSPGNEESIFVFYNIAIQITNSVMSKVSLQDALEYQLKTLPILESRLDPKNQYLLNALHMTGFIYMILSDYHTALGYLEKAVDIDTSKSKNYGYLAFAYNNLGYTLTHLNRGVESEKYFNLSENISPRNSWLYRNKAVWYATQNRKKEALDALEKAVELGYNDLAWLTNIEQLNILRMEERYVKLVNKLKAQGNQ